MKLHNQYYLLRHGEALSNVKKIVSSWPEVFNNPLTLQGRDTIKESAEELQDKHIDLIFSSDVLRAKQTAQIVGEALKVNPKFDTRLREIDFGSMNGRALKDFEAAFVREDEKIQKTIFGGENYQDVLKRVSEFLTDVDNQYHGKKILIISHECPLWILEGFVKGWTLEESLKNFPPAQRIRKGQIKELH